MVEYTQQVMDHFANARNAGRMPDPDGVGDATSAVFAIASSGVARSGSSSTGACSTCRTKNCRTCGR